jgi:hypothetical protein
MDGLDADDSLGMKGDDQLQKSNKKTGQGGQFFLKMEQIANDFNNSNYVFKHEIDAKKIQQLVNLEHRRMEEEKHHVEKLLPRKKKEDITQTLLNLMTAGPTSIMTDIPNFNEIMSNYLAIDIFPKGNSGMIYPDAYRNKISAISEVRSRGSRLIDLESFEPKVLGSAQKSKYSNDYLGSEEGSPGHKMYKTGNSKVPTSTLNDLDNMSTAQREGGRKVKFGKLQTTEVSSDEITHEAEAGFEQEKGKIGFTGLMKSLSKFAAQSEILAKADNALKKKKTGHLIAKLKTQASDISKNQGKGKDKDDETSPSPSNVFDYTDNNNTINDIMKENSRMLNGTDIALPEECSLDSDTED